MITPPGASGSKAQLVSPQGGVGFTVLATWLSQRLLGPSCLLYEDTLVLLACSQRLLGALGGLLVLLEVNWAFYLFQEISWALLACSPIFLVLSGED